MSIYLPNFNDQRIKDFCGANGATVDGFYKTLGDLGYTGSIGDRWKGYLTTKYGYYNGPHVNGYVNEADFTFEPPPAWPEVFKTNGTGAIRSPYEQIGPSVASLNQIQLLVWFRIDSSPGVIRTIAQISAANWGLSVTRLATNAVRITYTDPAGTPWASSSAAISAGADLHAAYISISTPQVATLANGYIYATVDGSVTMTSELDVFSEYLQNNVASTAVGLGASAQSGTAYFNGGFVDVAFWGTASTAVNYFQPTWSNLAYNAGVPLDSSSTDGTYPPFFRVRTPTSGGLPTVTGSSIPTFAVLGTGLVND